VGVGRVFAFALAGWFVVCFFLYMRGGGGGGRWLLLFKGRAPRGADICLIAGVRG